MTKASFSDHFGMLIPFFSIWSLEMNACVPLKVATNCHKVKINYILFGSDCTPFTELKFLRLFLKQKLN